MDSFLLDEEQNGTNSVTSGQDYNIGYVIQMLQANGGVQEAIKGNGTINGDVFPVSVDLVHNFQEINLFPDLKERTNINQIGGGTGSLSVAPRGLDINFETIVTINMVESGAGYNNTLGIYTIGDDGYIQAVKLAYANVKNPLNATKSELNALNKEQSILEKLISNTEKQIASAEKKIDGYQNQINKFQAKIDDVLAKPKLSKGDENKIETYQKQIDRYEEQIAGENHKIGGYQEKIAESNERLAEIPGEKDALNGAYSFTYNVNSQFGTEIGTFIIADGARKNNFDGLDLENGQLNFIYHLGQVDQRLAKITDSAADISLVYNNGSTQIILKGDVYHSTERGETTAINPDNAEHAVSGLVSADDSSTLRIGFEDLKNLGDADYNDVVFDLNTQTQTVYIPADYFNDTLYGGAGKDILNGGIGDDIIYGEGDSDTITGGAGKDTIYGGAGFDNISGGAGNDIIYGEAGNDTLNGDDGDDYIDGGDSNDYINGGSGNDTLLGGNGNDFIYGLDGTDTIYGDAGDDNLQGGMGNDTIYGGEGNDRIYGEEGDDFLYGGAGNDRIEGGGGQDHIDGGDGDDVLLGGADADHIFGGAGKDYLYGYDGDDFIYLSQGADIAYGQGGADTFVIEETPGKDNDMAFIMDFNVADGDRIDITDLLSGFDPDTDNIKDFVFVAQGFNTTIQIDRDGNGTEFGIDNVVRLQGNTTLSTDVQKLIDDGTLII